MSEPKNKGGRPRRAPGEKLQRVTLNLRPSIMFGLDLIARDRQTSLSQAAEYALATVLRGYAIDGKSALQIAQDAMLIDPKSGKPWDGVFLEYMQSRYDHVDDKSRALIIEEMKRLQLGASPLAVVTIPARLRTPEEAFIMMVVKQRPFDLGGNLDAQVKAIKDAFRLGLSVDEAAKQFPAAASQGQGKTTATAPRHKNPRTKRG